MSKQPIVFILIFERLCIVAFTQFDYDTVIELSTAWADALRCVKEFISLALGVTKTDMYSHQYSRYELDIKKNGKKMTSSAS